MKRQATKILVVCPLSAIGVWEDEFPQDCPEELMPQIVPVVGDMKDRIKILTKTYGSGEPLVFIINYDSLRNESVVNILKTWSPHILIVDEAHYTKNHTSARSKRTREIRKTAKYCLSLTGTPIPKDPRDLFGQYLIIDETVFGGDRGAFKRFKDKYCEMNFKFPSKVDRFKNMDDLARKIHTKAYRVKDTDCKDLPPLIERNIPVYFGSDSKKIYNQMATEMIAELDQAEIITARMAATKVLKLQQITGGFLMRKDEYLDESTGTVKANTVSFPVGSEKLDVCMDLVDRYTSDHKIIIGCRFKWEIAQLEAALGKRGISFGTIMGGVSGEERTDIRRSFQSTDGVRVIIFQVSAATAMTLIAGDIAILYSCTQKWDDYWQWLKRLHREGQNRPVYVLRLVVKGTVDAGILKSIDQKRSFTDYLVDRQSVKHMLRLID